MKRKQTPVYVDDLETDHHDPFHEDASNPNRWLITTCIAGVAGSFVIAGALLGVFSDNQAVSTAHASTVPDEIWQRPAVSTKGDLNSEVARTAALKPFAHVSVAYQPDNRSSEVTSNSSIVKASVVPVGPVSGLTKEMPRVLSQNVQFAAINTENMTTISKQPPPEPVDYEFTLNKGDTLIEKLVSFGVARDNASQLAASLETVYPGKMLKAGQKFVVTLDRQQDFYGQYVLFPVQLAFSPGAKEEITVEADDEGKFIARVNGKKKKAPSIYATPRSGQYRVAGKVTSSLYASARDKGVPDYIINQVIAAFSYDVDFQRQMKAGSAYEIYFGNPLSGSSKRRKVLHYAALTIKGKKKELYRFTNRRGRTAYYDSKGRGAAKFLLRTPISGARISSGYGMRRHPVLGYSKMHTGIDFAAPKGTPIRAAGSGKISYRNWMGGYGRVVQIQHSNGYMTRYAHMSRFAKGLRKGSRVRQGQVIGYVGRSGRVTGAHLHYEVRIGKRAVNPNRVRVAGKSRLRGKDLARFKSQRRKVIAMMKKTPLVSRVASLAK